MSHKEPEYVRVDRHRLRELELNAEVMGYKNALRQVSSFLLTGEADRLNGPTDDYYPETNELFDVTAHLFLKRELSFSEIKEAYTKRMEKINDARKK